jgi:phenylalanyl-tRNA synthetase alpha subunit
MKSRSERYSEGAVFLGIRDFIEYLREHREKTDNPQALPDAEREEILRQAEMMVGMTEAAVKELESVVNNRRVNLPEEHALRFAQDVFLYLKDEEEKVKETLR